MLENIEGEVEHTVDRIISGLKDDKVMVIKNQQQTEADALLSAVAEQLGLHDSLMLQAGFASAQKHREQVGEYFMSVNARGDYQYIPPHCEGTVSTNIQLAAFYAEQNTTDGGETILFHLDQDYLSNVPLYEVVNKVRIKGAELPQQMVAMLAMIHKVRIPDDLLRDNDEVLTSDHVSDFNIDIAQVPKVLKKHTSVILNRDVYSYWDNVASTDKNAAAQFERYLKENQLLRGKLNNESMDNAAKRRVYDGQYKLEDIIDGQITYKLQKGDLVLMNNLTWAHSTANWTPGSGERQIAAAFA